MTGHTDALSDLGDLTTRYRWAGTKSQVAGKEAGEHVQGREQKSKTKAEQEGEN